MSELSLFDLDAAWGMPANVAVSTPEAPVKAPAPKIAERIEQPAPAVLSLRAFDPTALAFAAVAIHAGIKDPALAPTRIDTAGCRFFDERELSRLANELLCGVRSDKPKMTPERWRLATEKVQKGDALR